MLYPDDCDVVRDIAAHDPDGGSRRPTDADYAAFEAYVVERHGRMWWDRYTVRDVDSGLTWVQTRTQPEV